MVTKDYSLTIAAYQHWNVKRADGRFATQVRAAVRASSKKKAAELLGVSLYHFNGYASETVNNETVKALNVHPPGTVLIHGDLIGDTIDGQHGWVVQPDV